jgi:hypothetical protein
LLTRRNATNTTFRSVSAISLSGTGGEQCGQLSCLAAFELALQAVRSEKIFRLGKWLILGKLSYRYISLGGRMIALGCCGFEQTNPTAE